jgi:hypothetical protein
MQHLAAECKSRSAGPPSTVGSNLRPTPALFRDDARGRSLAGVRFLGNLVASGGVRSMQMALLIGVQASGKSTFFRERFFATHVRVNLDMLRTRNRERQFIETCLRTGQPFAVDNTNPTRDERRGYIEAARAARFRVVGYYLQSVLEDCKRRNLERPSELIVPLVGLLGTHARLELPRRDEGFDELYYVRQADGGFQVEKWSDEI